MDIYPKSVQKVFPRDAKRHDGDAEARETVGEDSVVGAQKVNSNMRVEIIVLIYNLQDEYIAESR